MLQANLTQSTDLGLQCWKCRERRVRCGSETPQCVKCANKGLACPGYGPKRPLRWKKPQGPRAIESNPRTIQSEQGRVGYGETLPRLLALIDVRLVDQVAAHVQSKSRADRSDRTRDYVLSVFKAPSKAIALIIADNERVAPGLVAVDSPANPFRWPIGVTAEAPAYLDYVHASISAFHRIVQRRARDSEKGSQLLSLASSSPDPEEATFCHYRASALRGLNDALCKPTKNINVAALAGAMMLLFAQLQQGAYGHWRIHLDGFKTLINLHGGYECLIKERRRVSFVLTNVPIIDVISTTTSPVKKMNSDTIVWHMSYLKGLPQLDYDLGPTPAPIPQSLLKPIIMTNLARARSHHAAGQFQVPRFTLSEVMAELDAGVPSNHASHETMPVDHSQDSTFDYGLFVNCFRSAIALYSVEGYTSIESTNENPPDVSLTPSALKNIRNLAYDSLMQALRKIFRLKTNQDCKGGYWKFILWPLVIAGVQNVIVKRNRNDHDFICERLYEMAVDLGTLSMRDAAVFLNRFWDDMIASGVDGLLTNWDDIFVDAPLFLL